jgi:hypothetical protein
MTRAYTVHSGHEPPRTVVVRGKRPNWLLDVLRAAGMHGTTAIQHPGVRVADAVFKLRQLGINIATVTERHEGAFAGSHARYRLLDRLEPTSAIPAPVISQPATVVDHVG